MLKVRTINHPSYKEKQGVNSDGNSFTFIYPIRLIENIQINRYGW